ncbi:MAG: hypothetical protein ABIH26_05985, partial [Candidatus Eisenbacteria bacterium]
APEILKAIKKKSSNRSLSWTLARLLRHHRDAISQISLRPYVNGCLRFLARGDDRYRLPFEVLRNANPDMLVKAILASVRSARKSKNLDRAEKYLQLVNTEDLATLETRFELAIVRLRKVSKAPAAVSASYSAPFAEADSPLVLLSSVLRSDRFSLGKRLRAEAGFLGSDDYLYVGLHLAERSPLERELALSILRFIVRKYPRKKEARVARHRLQAEGIKV